MDQAQLFLMFMLLFCYQQAMRRRWRASKASRASRARASLQENERKRRRFLKQLVNLDELEELDTGEQHLQEAFAICCDPDRVWWVKPRSTPWFQRFVKHISDDAQWQKAFGMKKPSFEHLVERLSPEITRRVTNYRRPVPARVRVAATIYWLRHGFKLSSVSEKFSMGKSTASEVVYDTCKAVISVLSGHLRFPDDEADLYKVIREFDKVTSLPLVAGCISCTHIRIQRPKEYPEAYLKHNQHSIVLQAVVDARKRFLDVCVGWPGSADDGTIWRSSGLKRRIAQGEVLQRPSIRISEEVSLKPYLLGDGGHGVSPAIMTPYQHHRNMSHNHTHFNRELIKTRQVAECAFGLLKGKFKLMAQKIRMKAEVIPDIVYACCILHNFLIDCGDSNPAEEMRLLGIEPVQRDEDIDELIRLQAHNVEIAGDPEEEGQDIREAIVQYISK